MNADEIYHPHHPYLTGDILPPLEQFAEDHVSRKKQPWNPRKVHLLWTTHNAGSCIKLDWDCREMQDWLRCGPDGYHTLPDMVVAALREFFVGMDGAESRRFIFNSGSSIYDVAHLVRCVTFHEFDGYDMKVLLRFLFGYEDFPTWDGEFKWPRFRT